jgi:arsenate reductase
MRLSLLARQAVAELLGSAGLVTVVIGSGIAAQRLSTDSGLQLLENALITGAGLVALILAFGPVSGGHFNPVVTLADRAFGGVSTRQVLVYLPAQVAGGVVGAIAANLMFSLPAVSISTHHRSTGGLWLSEALATFGLIVLIFGLVRAGRGGMAPFAVGAYITAAYWWSSSTSFANPMIDVARMLSNTFAGIAPASVPMFVLMQVVGGAVAVAVVALLYPHIGSRADTAVVPHDVAVDSEPPVAEPTSADRSAEAGRAPRSGTAMTATIRPSTTADRPDRRNTVSDVPSVLFACIHNSGRSVAAQVLTRHYGGDGIVVRSAGSEPGTGVNPVVAEVLAERGLTVIDHTPTMLDADLVQASDVVITMGCGETCPVFPGKRYEDWPVDDPAGQDVDTVRCIVDDVDARVRKLLAGLTPART